MTWALTLHRLPDSMNVRERKSHWSRRRELQEITDEIGVLALVAKLPTATGKRWVQLQLECCGLYLPTNCVSFFSCRLHSNARRGHHALGGFLRTGFPRNQTHRPTPQPA